MLRSHFIIVIVANVLSIVLADAANSIDVENLLEEGNAAFSGRFMFEAVKSNPNKNIIASPNSVFTPLAQLALYSEGDTLDQILKVLNLRNKDDIRSVFPKVISDLNAQKEVTLNVASKIYSSDAFPLSEEFLDDTRQVFGSEAETLNFNQPQQSANIINEWVEDQTNNRIKNIAQPDMFTPYTRLVLANAIYFLGNWITRFDVNKTKPRKFYIDSETPVDVPTMYLQSNFRYGENDRLDCKVLEMPYQGGNFSFVVFLPNKINGLLDLLEQLQDPKEFFDAYNNMRDEKVNVYLPKIETESKFDLKEIMRKVGIVDLLDEGKSNLQGILETYEPLYVSDAVQKAFGKVDEKGTEAAAANVITINTYSARPQTFDFDADHPFIYYILFNKRVPIFCGTFVNIV